MAVDDKERAKAAATTVRLPPVGFWSYARQDDQLAAGRLSALRALLMQELQQQYGREPIRLFQDANTIPHGSDWEKEIKKALDTATFFIPIVTPNFIQSEWCCREVELFLERERRLGALHPELAGISRIFPILFIGIDDVDPENPEVLTALQKLQWFDFRPYRHRDFGEAAVREALSDLAANMRSLLRRKVTPPDADQPPTPPEPMEASAPTIIVPPPEPKPAEPVPGPVEPHPAPPRGAARPIEVGDVLNHIFEVKRFIKAGGMGQVFEGSNIITGERVAIKALLPALAADPKVIEMLQRESMTLTRLQHEALVQYRMLAKEPELGVLYIATEYIDGVDLGDVLDQVDRSPQALAALLERLASGLAAAHKLGAVHRDISPDNVMLPGGDLHRAKIIDFGIAKDLVGSLPTIVGDGFAGKLSFVAPEQLGEHGGEIGSWTDVYSLALVILSVARGEKVDMAGSFADAIRKRREGADISPAPEGLRPLLADMLRLDPAERLRTMDEVIARLAADGAATQSEAKAARLAVRREAARRRAEATEETKAQTERQRQAAEAEAAAEQARRDAEQETEREPERERQAAELAAANAVRHAIAERAAIDADNVRSQPPWLPIGLGTATILFLIVLFSGVLKAPQPWPPPPANVADGETATSPPPTASADELAAQYATGVQYYFGDGQPRNLAEAFRWFRRAGGAGSAEAQHMLGYMLSHGEGVSMDHAQAMQWYQRAAAQDYAPSQSDIGDLYVHGRGVARDYAQAMQWFQRAAAQGDAEAQVYIGWLYENGRGVTQDYAEAVTWYRRAAAQGAPNGQHNLGRLLYDGAAGVPRNQREGLDLIRRSAAAGRAEARNWLSERGLSRQAVAH